MSNEILDNEVIDNEVIDDKIIDINLQECYICYENCDILSPCDCKTLYMHKECQKKLINKSNISKCKICNKEYNNVKVNIKYKLEITNFGKFFISKNIIFITVNGCFITETYIAFLLNYYILIISGIMLAVILFLIILIIKDIIAMYRNNIYIIKKKQVKEYYILND